MMSSSACDKFFALSKDKVTNSLLDYVAREFESIIACPKPSSYSTTATSIPSPPLSHKSFTSNTTTPSPPFYHHKPIVKAPMPLRMYIEQVVLKSRMDTGTLILSLSYARRLRSKLYGTSKGMECTHHRIFLATLIIACKYVHDASIKNKYWVSYSLHLFSNIEVNLMEKQLLQLLNYNLEIRPEEIDTIIKDMDSFQDYSSYPASPVSSYQEEVLIFNDKKRPILNSYKPSPPLLHL